MEENKSQQTLIKIIALFAGFIFLVLLVTGIIQTTIHNNLITQSQELNARNEQTLQDINDVDNEITIKNGDEYLDDYLEQEEGYGENGEIIITPATTTPTVPVSTEG